ncbi:hypothetical protein [Aquitalea pelogenes]|uniref:hypothetical protein n=1 Tax=Aquitalea pelogenes TaxID=1293573 RepID=UPI0035ADFAD2
MSNFYTVKRKNGLTHSESGPAVVTSDGTKMWYLAGVKHRLDGPAVEWSDGTKEWWVAGQRHRRKGLAIENRDGSGEAFYSTLAASFEKVSNLIDLETWLRNNKLNRQ